MWKVFEKLKRPFSNFFIFLGDLWQIMMIYRTLKKFHDKWLGVVVVKYSFSQFSKTKKMKVKEFLNFVGGDLSPIMKISGALKNFHDKSLQ